MKQEQDTSRSGNAKPLWLTLAYKAASASGRAMMGTAIAALVALSLVRLSCLEENTRPEPEIKITQTSYDQDDGATRYDPPPPASPEEDPGNSPGSLLGLLGLALAIAGGKAAASWTERNGYDMKRFENWANRKSRKRKDDPSP